MPTTTGILDRTELTVLIISISSGTTLTSNYNIGTGAYPSNPGTSFAMGNGKWWEITIRYNGTRFGWYLVSVIGGY